MTLSNLTRKLTKNGFEFETKWYNSSDYCLHIILGNCEYLIRHNDHKAIKELWFEIKKYW